VSLRVSSLEQINQAKIKKKTIIWKSEFNFVNSFNGFRPGFLHTFLSNVGGGKSSLAKSIVFDATVMNPNKKILLWLTEDRKIDWEADFFEGLLPEKFENNLRIFSEKDLLKNGKMSPEDLFKFILKAVYEEEIELLILDNITTSDFYTIEDYDLIAKMIQTSMPEEVATVIFAHTNKTYKKYGRDFMEPDNIFGSAYLSKISEFFGCLYGIDVPGDGKYTAMVMEKNRHYGVKSDKKYFNLAYNPNIRMYGSDSPVTYEQFKKVWNEKESL